MLDVVMEVGRGEPSVLETCHGAKYGVLWGDWTSEVVRRPKGGFSLWKGIIPGWDKFAANICFKIGDGRRVKFGHDRWYGGRALKDSILSQMFIGG